MLRVFAVCRTRQRLWHRPNKLPVRVPKDAPAQHSCARAAGCGEGAAGRREESERRGARHRLDVGSLVSATGGLLGAAAARGAGPAARRRDVTVAAAVVGAGSAAAKCELRRARAGGGVE